MRTWSIRSQLLALVAAVAVPLAALHAYDVARAARLARQAAGEASLSLARLVARSVQQGLDRRRARLDALAERPLVRALDPARCDPILAQVPEADPGIANAATFDARGALVCSGSPPPPDARPLVDRRTRDAAGVRAPGVTEVFDSPLLGRAVAGIEAPLRDGTGALAGWIRLGLDLGALSDGLDVFEAPRGARIAIVDPAGRVVAGTGDARAWLGREAPDPALRAPRPASEGSAAASGGGEDELVSWSDVPGTPWRVWVTTRLDAVLAEARAALARDAAVLAIVLASVISLAFVLSRRITGPVGALERELRLMEKGLADASIPVTLIRPDGSIAYANEAAARSLRCTREALLGSRVFDWDVDYPEERWSDAWMGIREAGSIRIQTHNRRADGVVFPVETHLEHVRFEGEEFAFAFSRDLTERARAEEALRRAQDQMLHAQKMEAVGRLAGGVAHDFNNLLTVILSCAQTLADALPPDDERRSDAEEITKAGRTAAGLTKQLLAFSRKQAIAPRVLRLGELVGATDKMLRRLIGEDVTLLVFGAEASWRVRVDPGSLEQVLLNLAVNARDAMPSGGTLSIEVSRRHLAGPLADGGASIPAGRWVVLRVSDTGSGMDEDVRRHAFEPFFSTKPQGQGTGLGLATVYGIVRQAGGHVALESAPGRGTTFRIYLPEVDEATAIRTTPSPRPPPLRSPGATLLVVEDDLPLRAIMERALSDAGYRVLAAASGAEALRAAAEHSGPIDLLLTDVIMPGMNGRELAERLAAARPATPALFLSGYTDEILGPQGVLAPGVHLLQKPFTAAELVAAVGRRLLAA